MNEKIRELFEDKKLVERIQNKLPKLFHLAELESSRAGKIGMEVIDTDNKKKTQRKRCKHCHRILDRILFASLMTEEWSWNGEGYNECTAKHSLVTDPEQHVRCPHCDKLVGKGIDFGFGFGYK